MDKWHEMDSVRIGFYSDPHYALRQQPGEIRQRRKSLERMQKAYALFEDEKCDLVICMGDLIDHDESHAQEIENLTKVAQVIHSSSMPTMCIMGNHDAFSFTQEEFYRVLGGCEPMDLFLKGKNLIFEDACWFENGKHYMPGDEDWTDTCIPDLPAFAHKLSELEGEIHLFLHQSLDPDIDHYHRLNNADQVVDILEKNGRVRSVIQGHYHPGKKSCHNGIRYITFAALCEQEEAVEIIDF